MKVIGINGQGVFLCRECFFAILLAQEGHDVIAIDYTANMLKYAEGTANKFNVKQDLRQMDAQNFEFEEEVEVWHRTLW